MRRKEMLICGRVNGMEYGNLRKVCEDVAPRCKHRMFTDRDGLYWLYWNLNNDEYAVICKKYFAN